MPVDTSKFKDIKVLIIGDVMWDQYKSGECTRISPEAPVPVILNPVTTSTIGGAGNVMANVISLGAQAKLMTSAGNDIYGDVIKREIFKINPLCEDGLIDIAHRERAIVKTRIVANGKQVARIDLESGLEHRSVLHMVSKIIPAIQWCDIVIVSDYAKGFVSNEIMDFVRINCKEFGKKFIVDPKGNNPDKYSGAYAITPNKKEYAELFKKESQAILPGAHTIKTCGANGIEVFSPDESYISIASSEPKQVCDVSGAGDTVIAAFTIATASGHSVEESAMFANTCAGIVVGKQGTATVTIDEINQYGADPTG